MLIRALLLVALIIGVLAASGCEKTFREVEGTVIDVQYGGEAGGNDMFVQVTFDDGRTLPFSVWSSHPPDLRLGRKQRIYVTSWNRIDRVALID